MKSIKKLISLFVAIVLAFSFAGCCSNTASTDATDAVIYESTYPVTVTDQAGREVTIEKEPERIISGYYISTSALIALGLEDKLVGIEAKAASRSIYSLSAPQIIDLPNVGTAKAFDLEGAVSLTPDLVFLPLKLKDAAASLEELGIDVLLVNPESHSLLKDMITFMGTATNTTAKAKELIGMTEEISDSITDKVKDSEKPTVYLAGNSSLLSTAGEKMYQSDMITLAGGINVASEIEDTYWVEISYEQFLSWNPDYIILASDASYSVEDVLNDQNLSNLSAVKEGKVYQLPNKAEAWDSPVPGGILGSAWLMGILHPDKCTTDEINDRIDLFYETFYGFTYREN